jgi:hypothetical protein
MLTDQIRLAGGSTDWPEDILSSCLGVIFPEDITHHYGGRDNGVIYWIFPFRVRRPRINGDYSTHFLWNASLQLAEFIEDEGTK